GAAKRQRQHYLRTGRRQGHRTQAGTRIVQRKVHEKDGGEIMKRLFGLIVLIAAAASAQNWPQLRGPQASGVADGKPLATTWNAEKNEGILWKTPIPGLAHSSPIVWGDRVFVSTAVSSQADSDLKVGLYGDVEPS